MHDFGRTLIGLGLLLVIAGALFLVLGRIGIPFGRLPGDIALRGRRVSFFAPLGTCLLLSVLFSLLLYVFGRFRH